MKHTPYTQLTFGFAVFAVSFAVNALVAVGDLTHYSKPESAFSYAVTVERGDLAYTRQILAIDADPGDFGAGELIKKLETIAALRDAKLSDVVRLNIFLADERKVLRAAAEKMVVDHWPAGKTPALTFIPGRIPGNVPLACDAVIALNQESQNVVPITDSEAKSQLKVAAFVAPAARDIIYASGRAMKGKAYEESVPLAIDALLKDYVFTQGATRNDVLQIRAYIGDLDHWVKAKKLIQQTLAADVAPPIVFIQWARNDSVEIEFITSAPYKAKTTETVSFKTPKTLKKSPVFSRIALLHSDTLTFMSGMVGSTNHNPEMQVASLFDELQLRAKAVGSDLRHLVKATYLVSDQHVDQAVNALRPNYYDPERPPAASKIFRKSIGVDGRHLLVDMITVPITK
ncbi:MAG: hypothetical protein GY903_13725 [Fuerstiella sp.]|nr:hypothetical protein [Fuerstiella sp.]